MRRLVATLAQFALALIACASAHAATITVNSTADTVAVDGACTLREALNSSNNNNGGNWGCVSGEAAPVVDAIVFDIEGEGPHVIAPASYLGQIDEALTIDGSTQAGYVPNTATPDDGGLNGTIMIELSGENCASCNFPFGLAVQTGEFTVRGIAISHYPYALNEAVSTSATFRIEGCYLGTGADGLALADTETALGFGVGNWIIGGTQPAQRNLIAGSNRAIFTSGSASITLQGNLIGTDRSGLAPLPFGQEAMQLRIGPGRFAQIGGSDPGARNVIASAASHGVHLLGWGGDGSGMRVEGNTIGVGIDGTTPLPNGDAGVRWGNSVPAGSGAPLIAGNLIAWNLGAGVEIAGSNETIAEVVGNTMHDNAIGIDLDGNGITPNDAGDADTGANRRMNFPEFSGIERNGDEYTIAYRVDTAVANADYPLHVDFYAAASASDAEGALWLGSDTIDASDAQTWRSATVANPDGGVFVATATDAAGRTSEFSPVLYVAGVFADGFE